MHGFISCDTLSFFKIFPSLKCVQVICQLVRSRRFMNYDVVHRHNAGRLLEWGSHTYHLFGAVDLVLRSIIKDIDRVIIPNISMKLLLIIHMVKRREVPDDPIRVPIQTTPP